MTQNSEFRFFLNLALRIGKVIANIDIGHGFALNADDVVMVVLFDGFVSQNLIMEMDGVNDGGVDEEIEFSIECDFVDREVVFFQERQDFVCRKRLHSMREDLEKCASKLRHTKSACSKLVSNLTGFRSFFNHTPTILTQLSCVSKTLIHKTNTLTDSLAFTSAPITTHSKTHTSLTPSPNSIARRYRHQMISKPSLRRSWLHR